MRAIAAAAATTRGGAEASVDYYLVGRRKCSRNQEKSPTTLSPSPPPALPRLTWYSDGCVNSSTATCAEHVALRLRPEVRRQPTTWKQGTFKWKRRTGIRRRVHQSHPPFCSAPPSPPSVELTTPNQHHIIPIHPSIALSHQPLIVLYSRHKAHHRSTVTPTNPFIIFLVIPFIIFCQQ